MNSNSPEALSSQEVTYDYPQTKVNRSLASLDLNTLIMRSNTRRALDEAQSSLADSSYELLSRSVYETSDDEGHTESLASTDIQTPDDLSSIADSDGFEEDDDDYMEDGSQHLAHPPVEPAYQPLAAQDTVSPEDSMMTSMADTQRGGPSYLKLEEVVSSEDDGVVELRGTITEFSDASGLPSVLQGYGCPELRLSVKMTLSRHFMPISRSFRLLYIGEFPDWAVNLVNNHIGAALNATPSSTRYNIVQDYDLPGSASSSKVQLERSGSELVVDHCNTPKIISSANGPPQVIVTLDDGSELTFGPGKVIRPRAAPLPDLVIFGHATIQSESDSMETATSFRIVRQVLQQHQISSTDIAVVRPYTGEAYTFDPHSLQLCIEGRSKKDHRFQTQKTLPIDVYAFCAIDPSQLNRHLAYLNDRSMVTKLATVKTKRGDWSVRNILASLPKTASSSSSSSSPWWLRHRSWLAVITTITMMVVAMIAQPALKPLFSAGSHQIDVHAVTSISLCRSTPSTSLVTPTSEPFISTVLPTLTGPKGLTTMHAEEKPQGSWRDRSASSKEDNAGSFEIEVTGDHQFMLRLSKQLVSGKRKVHPQVQVQRNLEAVPVRVARSSDDTYTIDIEQEYPVGNFNVSVVARRKPLLQQSFEVKLGSNKSTLSSLSRLAQNVKHELAIAQSSVKSVSAQVSKSLSSGVAKIEDQTQYWGRQFHDSTQTVAQHLQGARKKAARQLSIGSRVTKDVSKNLQDNWQTCASRASKVVEEVRSDVWQRTRPWRTSPHVLRARKRALQLRCQMERKLGKEATCERLKDKNQHKQEQNLKAKLKTKRGCKKSKR